MSKKKKTMKKRIRSIWNGILSGLKFAGKKIWGARQWIVAIFVAGFAILAKGFGIGYRKRSEEVDEKVDERINLLNVLSGFEGEKVEQIQEAQDLVDQYGADALREMARFCEEGPPVDD